MTGRQQLQMPLAHKGAVATAFSADGRYLLTAGEEVIVWNTITGAKVRTFPGRNHAAFHPSGDRMAVVAPYKGAVTVWKVKTGDKVNTLSEEGAKFVALDYSPDGQWLALVNQVERPMKGTLEIQIREAASGKPVSTITGLGHLAGGWRFTRDQRRVVTAENNSNEVKLWDARTGREVFELRGHSGPVLALAFSPDGNVLATGSDDHTIRSWDGTPSN
jgi:WD40 repeat protein